MSTAAVTKAFFVAGGTVPPGSPSYVERSADRELYEALVSGEYCYVLNSRQMGKSSLAVRTVARLGEAGIRTAFIDLTRIGGPNVTAEQWFAGLLAETGRVLGLRQEAVAFLREHRELGPAQRFLSFLHEAALPASASPLVVMVDEIDAVRSLSFSTDELFAGVRQLHNGRASEAALSRLTFCLLGAALPSDLIRDPRTTPFNVGRRIELRDFTADEAEPFATALGPNGDDQLKRVLYWTDGHPFLTQAICAELAIDTAKGVDELVRARYLGNRAQETDTNLTDVGNRLLGRGDPDVHHRRRADTLSLYAKMLKGGIQDDESNPNAARLKMSGIGRLKNGRLEIRNRIYQNVFDAKWIRNNMPGQELLRQRRAFWKGAIRTSAIAAVVLAVIGFLAWNNARLARDNASLATIAVRQRDQARYEGYVTSMQTLEQDAQRGDLYSLESTLTASADSQTRGWEWKYWSHYAKSQPTRINGRFVTPPNFGTNAAGRIMAVTDSDTFYTYDVATLKATARVPLPHSLGGSWNINFYRDGRRVLLQDVGGDNLLIVDAIAGKILRRRSGVHLLIGFYAAMWWDAAGDKYTLIGSRGSSVLHAGSIYRLDLDTLDLTPAKTTGGPWTLWFSGSGSRVAWFQSLKGDGHIISIRRTSDLKEIRHFPVSIREVDIRFHPDDKTLIISTGKAIERQEIDSGKVLWSLPLGKVGGLQISPDGRRMLAIPFSPGCSEYDISSSKPRLLRRFTYEADFAYALNGRKIVEQSKDLRIEDATANAAETEVSLGGGPFMSRDGYTDRTQAIYNYRDYLLIDRQDPLASPTRQSMAGAGFADNSGRYLVDSSTQSKLTIHDSRRRYPNFDIPKPLENALVAVSASPQGNLLCVPRDNASMQAYAVPSGRPVKTFGPIAVPDDSRFSTDGCSFAVGDSEGWVSVWRTTDWRLIARGRVSTSSIGRIAFSDDGSRVAAGASFGECGILDIQTSHPIAFQGQADSTSCIAWSHDGSRIATGGYDESVRIWDSASGRLLGVIGKHASLPITMWFTKGDKTLCSVDIGGTLKLWRTSDQL